MSEYTEEQVQARVAEAIAPIQAKLDEVVASQDQASNDARIAELVEAHEAAVAELQAEVDAATAAAGSASKAYEDLVAYLTEEQEKADASAAFEVRKTEVAEVIGDRFSDEYVEANVSRWASLEAEAFEALIADWEAASVASKAAAKAKSATSASAPVTAMTAGAASNDDEAQDVASIRKGLQLNRQAVRAVGARTY